MFPPTKLQELVYWLREGVTWTKEKTEGFTLLLKRWVYSKWVRALKPSPVFPKEILVGSLGELSHVLARETEVPEEFVFAASLTVLGAICAGRLKVNAAVAAEPRLYTVLLGKSYTDKKSTALRKVFEFFAPKMGNVEILRGVGSAEGLAREFREHANILLAFDEFRAFFEKAKVQTSVLLPMVTSLFEANEWDNPTKMSTVSVRNARLSLVGCCTEEIYERLWSTEAIGIGFLNRLFVVGADRKERVSGRSNPTKGSWPEFEKGSALRLRICRRRSTSLQTHGLCGMFGITISPIASMPDAWILGIQVNGDSRANNGQSRYRLGSC